MSRNILAEELKKQGMSMYQLSQSSGIPYSTVSDICKGKTLPHKCSAETIYQIARILNIPMEFLVKPYVENSFDDIFHDRICFRLSKSGMDLFLWIRRTPWVHIYWEQGEHFKTLYLVAMYDFLKSKQNMDRLPDDFGKYRKNGFQETVLSNGIPLKEASLEEQLQAQKDMPNAIPEFWNLGILEAHLPEFDLY